MTELYMIKTKPIASYRVDIYTEDQLRKWFKDEYRPVLKAIGIKYAIYIYNMDKKGARIACSSG
jgi:hypothetical protein